MQGLESTPQFGEDPVRMSKEAVSELRMYRRQSGDLSNDDLESCVSANALTPAVQAASNQIHPQFALSFQILAGLRPIRRHHKKTKNAHNLPGIKWMRPDWQKPVTGIEYFPHHP